MTVARTIGLVVAVGLATVYVALPPRQRPLPDPAPADRPIRGVLHVHTKRSDGTGTIEQVAAAARRAGLEFVIVTDHSDAMRVEPASYRGGVLCIDAAEISTQGGHVIGLGLGRTPYPLAGEPRDVIDDIRRFGGFSIVAHPMSEKRDLRWSDFTLPFDAFEWLNGDSEWRDERPAALARVLLTYWFRGSESLATLLDRPAELLARWDVLTQRKSAVALAGSDAHARIGFRGIGEPYDNAAALPVPGYEQIFRTFSISLQGLALTGDAFVDARAVVDAIRRGHVYSSIDAFAAPASLRFSGTSGGHRAQAGDTLAIAGPVSLRAETNGPAGAQITLFRDGERIARNTGPLLEYSGPNTPATYRIEIDTLDHRGDRQVPWIVSNPIYVRAPASGPREAPKPTAKEFAPQVRVNAIAPGLVSTGWMDKMGKDRIKDVLGMKLIKRPAQPEEIAKLASFLASDDAAMITGEIVYIDGGMRLK